MTDLPAKRKNKDSMAEVTQDTLHHLAADAPPPYEADDGPLTCIALDAIRMEAANLRPKGRVIEKRSLL